MTNSDEALVYPAYVLLSTIEEIFNHPAKLESIVKDYKTQVTLDDYRKIHKV
jgi:hypothetical protein